MVKYLRGWERRCKVMATERKNVRSFQCLFSSIVEVPVSLPLWRDIWDCDEGAKVKLLLLLLWGKKSGELVIEDGDWRLRKQKSRFPFGMGKQHQQKIEKLLMLLWWKMRSCCCNSENVRWRVSGSGKARKETRLYFMMRPALFHVVSTRSSIL